MTFKLAGLRVYGSGRDDQPCRSTDGEHDAACGSVASTLPDQATELARLSSPIPIPAPTRPILDGEVRGRHGFPPSVQSRVTYRLIPMTPGVKRRARRSTDPLYIESCERSTTATSC